MNWILSNVSQISKKDNKKVGVYKVVRNIANIAVNQVKEFTATLPKALKESIFMYLNKYKLCKECI